MSQIYNKNPHNVRAFAVSLLKESNMIYLICRENISMTLVYQQNNKKKTSQLTETVISKKTALPDKVVAVFLLLFCMRRLGYSIKHSLLNLTNQTKQTTNTNTTR